MVELLEARAWHRLQEFRTTPWMRPSLGVTLGPEWRRARAALGRLGNDDLQADVRLDLR
ncbi:hypothetical protein P4050_30590 [Pseudomonas aeruginosa]|nr:hypothetical protein [Pseudomonas aeruginosa]